MQLLLKLCNERGKNVADLLKLQKSPLEKVLSTRCAHIQNKFGYALRRLKIFLGLMGNDIEEDSSYPKPVGRRSVTYYGVGHMLNDITAACWFTYLLLFLTDIGLTPKVKDQCTLEFTSR
ncbi:Major facilitator superfamily protein [Euphorbia peplus]|nr:Major facilitator superfamily protein [Euphorbia peplus]